MASGPGWSGGLWADVLVLGGSDLWEGLQIRGPCDSSCHGASWHGDIGSAPSQLGLARFNAVGRNDSVWVVPTSSDLAELPSTYLLARPPAIWGQKRQEGVPWGYTLTMALALLLACLWGRHRPAGPAAGSFPCRDLLRDNSFLPRPHPGAKMPQGAGRPAQASRLQTDRPRLGPGWGPCVGGTVAGEGAVLRMMAGE